MSISYIHTFEGIRSQSKPHDIMNEVYRAMKLLDFVRNFNLYKSTITVMFLLLGMENRQPIPCTRSTQKPSHAEVC